MAKKRKKASVGKWLPFLAALLGIAAFCMLFLNALKTESILGTIEYKATDIVFGNNTEGVGFKFNFLALFAFVLPLAAAVLMIFPASGKLFKFIGLGLFVGGAVLLFIMPGYVAVDLGSWGSLEPNFSLAIGTIIGGILSCLGAVVSAVDVLDLV